MRHLYDMNDADHKKQSREAERNRKRAEALRENLKRRKAQITLRTGGSKKTPAGDDKARP